MYIHLLKFKELPENIYKIILTSDNDKTVKHTHEIFYTIEYIKTYKLDDLRPEIFIHLLKIMNTYNENINFIYCYDIDKFELIIKNIELLDEYLEDISIENSPLKLTKRESKKIYNIIKFFIKESNKEHLFISPESLYNIKHFDENKYKIYLDDNSSIHCIDNDKDEEIIEENTQLYYITILDQHIYLSESKDNFIEIEGDKQYDDIFKDLTSRELNMLIDSKPNMRSTKISNILDETNFLPGKIFNIGTKKNQNQFLLPDPGDKYICSELNHNIEAFDHCIDNIESIISDPIVFNGTHPYKNKTMDELTEERNKELLKPTTIKHIDKKIDQRYKIQNDDGQEEEDYEEIIEEEIQENNSENNSENNLENNTILFTKNNVIDKNIIIYDIKQINDIKQSKYLSEIEMMAEYIVPELDAVKELLKIKFKNIDKMTFDVIEKNIMKINEFLYADDNKQIINAYDIDKSSQMLGLVRDFLSKNCVRKLGSKVYSTYLYDKFVEYLMLTSPCDAVYFNKNNFTPLVKKLNYKTKRDSSGIYWTNVSYNDNLCRTLCSKFNGRMHLV